MLVDRVIGEFDFLEGDGLLGELVSRQRRVGVHTKAGGERRVSLARHQPRRPVVGVAVALRVHRHDVHQDGVTRVDRQPRETHSYRREHTPGNTCNPAIRLVLGKVTEAISYFYLKNVF